MAKILKHNVTFEGKPGEVVSLRKGEAVPAAYEEFLTNEALFENVEEVDTPPARGGESEVQESGDEEPLTKAEIQDLLRARGLPVSGTVDVLRARLAEAEAEEAKQAEDAEVDLESLSDEDLAALYAKRTGDTEERSREEILAALDV